jgi:Tol biopolymer transport system component
MGQGISTRLIDVGNSMWSFHSGSNGVSIWRLNADGSNAMQLTNGKTDVNPVCSPDGRWEVQIVSLDAGPNPTRRTLSPDSRVAGAVVFTPDGSALAYPILENGVSNIRAQPLDGSPGRQVTNFESGTFRTSRWCRTESCWL